MNLTRSALTLLLGAALLAAASIEEHQKARPVSYACDMTVSSGTMTTRLHQAFDGPDRMRVDLTKPMAMSVIIRRDQGRMITLLGKSAVVKPLDEIMAQRFAPPNIGASAYDITAAGEETVDGVVCDRFTATPKPGTGGDPGTMWVGQSDHALRKWATTDQRTTVTCDNHVFAKPAGDLFEIPPGTKPMEMPNKP